MKLILQAIKSLLRRVEMLIDSTAAGLSDEITRLDNEKIGAQNPVMYGAFRLNPEAGVVIGEDSTAEGRYCTAPGTCSHAEGRYCTASGDSSHAEGSSCTASGYYSHAEGGGCTASGSYSHAEGRICTAYGYYSHAEGFGCVANGPQQHVQGRYNIEDKQSDLAQYAHIVGNGQDDNDRSNAHTLDWNGNAWFAGTVEGTALILKSGTAGSSKRFRITVDDSGALSATEVT